MAAAGFRVMLYTCGENTKAVNQRGGDWDQPTGRLLPATYGAVLDIRSSSELSIASARVVRARQLTRERMDPVGGSSSASYHYIQLGLSDRA